MKNVRNKLLINIDHGNEEMRFISTGGLHLATGYLRVVIGKRGPYVEFHPRQIVWGNFCVPASESYRLKNRLVFYDEYRSLDPSWVKLYFQKRTVAYADYKVGLCYMSPMELLRDEYQPVILSP